MPAPGTPSVDFHAPRYIVGSVMTRHLVRISLDEWVSSRQAHWYWLCWCCPRAVRRLRRRGASDSASRRYRIGFLIQVTRDLSPASTLVERWRDVVRIVFVPPQVAHATPNLIIGGHKQRVRAVTRQRYGRNRRRALFTEPNGIE